LCQDCANAVRTVDRTRRAFLRHVARPI